MRHTNRSKKEKIVEIKRMGRKAYPKCECGRKFRTQQGLSLHRTKSGHGREIPIHHEGLPPLLFGVADNTPFMAILGMLKERREGVEREIAELTSRLEMIEVTEKNLKHFMGNGQN